MIELQIPQEYTEGGRYSPEARFIDEISDELDVIEDKKAPLLCEYFMIGFCGRIMNLNLGILNLIILEFNELFSATKV